MSEHSGPQIGELLYSYAHAYGLFDEASGSVSPTQPPPEPTDSPVDDESCDAVDCSHLPPLTCDDSGQYSLSDPGCDSGRCGYFTSQYCESGCDRDTGLCIVHYDDPDDESACDGVSCDHLPPYTCDDAGQTSYFSPGCSAGRCGYFESQSCANGCDQNTGMCIEEISCTDACPDHCEGNVAYSAFSCDNGECEWITRECPFGCDESVAGMCLQPVEQIVLSASKGGYQTQQQSLGYPDPSGSVIIVGQVLDLDSGELVAGAVVAILEGAQLAETVTDENGSYEIIALGNSSEVMSSAQVNFTLEPLSVRVELVLEDVPMYPAGAAIVESAMRVAAAVYDPNGNLLPDRELNFSAFDPNGASWGSWAGSGMTNDSGYQVKELTAGAFEFGTIVGSGLVPVTVEVIDVATGVKAEAVFNVRQIEMEVDYYPVLATCADCGPYPITVTLNHPLGDELDDVAITAGLDGAGFLTTEMFGTSGSDEITVRTDANNQATFYFKPEMDDLTQIHTFSIYILAEGLGVIEAVPVRAEPLDIALARFEPVSFSGRIGDYAYFNVGVKDLNAPNAPLDRLGLGTHSPIKYMLTIRQTYPEIDLANSINYGEQLHLVEDGSSGFRLRDSNSNPPSPHITPIYEGTNVYRVEVVAVDSVSGNPVYDGFIRNNDTAIIVDAANVGDWFHTIMVDGVLTPHTRVQALIKCAASFIPPVGTTMTAIDAASDAYKAGYGSSQDSFVLFQKSVDQIAGKIGDAAEEAIAVNEALRLNAELADDMARAQEVSAIGKRLGIGAKLLKVVGYVGNLISCYSDFESAAVEETRQGSSIGPPVCCLDCTPMFSAEAAYQIDYYQVNQTLIPFIQKMMTQFPDYYAVMVLASPQSSAVLTTEYGELTDVFASNGVYFYMLPVGTTYQLQLSNTDAADVVVFGGTQGEDAEVFIHLVEEDAPFDAAIEISSQSDLDLNLDFDQDGTVDQSLSADSVTLDLAAPTITLTDPTVDVEGYTMIRAEIADEGGSGVDWDSLQVLVDGFEVSSYAEISDGVLRLPVSGLTAGEHQVSILVMDGDLNIAESTWTISSIGYQTTLAEMLLLPSILFCGFGGLGALILVVLVLRRRKKERQQPSGKKPRRWIMIASGGIILLCIFLGTVGVIFNLTDTGGIPYPGSANLYNFVQPDEVYALPEWAEPPTQEEIDRYWQEVNDGLLLPEEGIYITD